MIEPLYARYVQEIHGVDVPTPFPRMPYDEMLTRFGTDKPDLRYGMELADLKAVFEEPGSTRSHPSGRRGRRDQGSRGAGRRAALSARSWTSSSRTPRAAAPPGLVWMVVEADGRALAGREVPVEGGDRWIVRADRRLRRRPRVHRRRPGRTACTSPSTGSAGDLADRLDLIPEGRWEYCLVHRAAAVRLERRGGASGSSNHHPFTAPRDRRPRPETAKAQGVRPRPERLRGRRRRDPDPPAGRAAEGVRGARPVRGGDRGEVRSPAPGVPLRRAAARRDRDGPRPARDAAGREGVVARRDRVPEGAVGRRPAHGRAGAGRRGTAPRARRSGRSYGPAAEPARGQGGRDARDLPDADVALLTRDDLAYFADDERRRLAPCHALWIDAADGASCS